MKPRMALFLIIVTAASLTGCKDQHEQAVSAATQRQPLVQTATAHMESIGAVVNIPARIQADPAKVVHIYPPAGGRLVEIRVHLGDRVAKGQTLAILESSDVAQARSDFDKAKAEEVKASRGFTRSKLLFEHKVLSERELDEAQAAQAEAQSELARARERLQVLGAAPTGATNAVSLTAPRAGIVTELAAAPGELSKSTDNANAICTIAEIDQVWVTGDLFERDLASVHTGDLVDVTVSAYPDRHWSGKVSYISDTVDPQSRTLKVRVVLANTRHELKPEMFATISTHAPAVDRLVIPASAVLREGGDTAVMVQTANGKYERRLVRVAVSEHDRTVVTEGLKPGETIVTQGAALVRGEEQ